MDRISFQNKVREMTEKNPRLFTLESDAKVDIEKIEDVEKYYDIILPDTYKDFVSQHGGGYFGFIVVYSCDCNGMFYIKDNVLKEWVMEKSFFPVVDLETGDFLGFEIDAGICKSKVTLYSHEEEALQGMQMDFYEALLKYGLKCDESVPLENKYII